MISESVLNIGLIRRMEKVKLVDKLLDLCSLWCSWHHKTLPITTCFFVSSMIISKMAFWSQQLLNAEHTKVNPIVSTKHYFKKLWLQCTDGFCTNLALNWNEMTC
jgi:hypothetical protein